MKWKDFKKTEDFNKAAVVVVYDKNENIMTNYNQIYSSNISSWKWDGYYNDNMSCPILKAYAE